MAHASTTFRLRRLWQVSRAARSLPEHSTKRSANRSRRKSPPQRMSTKHWSLRSRRRKTLVKVRPTRHSGCGRNWRRLWKSTAFSGRKRTALTPTSSPRLRRKRRTSSLSVSQRSSSSCLSPKKRRGRTRSVSFRVVSTIRLSTERSKPNATPNSRRNATACWKRLVSKRSGQRAERSSPPTPKIGRKSARRLTRLAKTPSVRSGRRKNWLLNGAPSATTYRSDLSINWRKPDRSTKRPLKHSVKNWMSRTRQSAASWL